jgi:hypothetical protein
VAVALGEPVPWAASAKGALLQGLLDIVGNNIPAGDNVIIENVYGNIALRNIVMEGHLRDDSKLYKEVTQLLNQYPCRIASPVAIETRPMGLPWPDNSVVAEDIERPLLERIYSLEHERDEIYESLAVMRQENEVFNREGGNFSRGRWEITEDDLPDLFTQWIDDAEKLLAENWGISWRVAKPFWGMCVEPILIRKLIQKGDPMGHGSFAWPAFLLGRAYEILWNRKVIDPLARFFWQSGEAGEQIINVVKNNRRLKVIKLELADKRHFSAPPVCIYLNYARENTCSLRDIQLVLWDDADSRIDARPIEVQETVREWLQLKNAQWIWDRTVREEVDLVRTKFRNPVAHGDIIIPETDYMELEEALLSGDHPSMMKLIAIGE